MKLHSPEFELGLRRSVKRAVSESAALRREYRRNKSPWWPWKIKPWFARMIFAIFGTFVLLTLINVLDQFGKTPWVNLEAIALWTFLASFFLMEKIQAAWSRDPEVSALFCLPVAEDFIFKWQRQKVLRRSFWLLTQITATMAMLAYLHHFSWWQWIAALLIGALTWLTVLSLALAGFVWIPVWVRSLLNAALIFTGFAGAVVGRHFVTAATFAPLIKHASGASLFLPTGWPLSLFHALLQDGDWEPLWTLLLMAGVIGTLPYHLTELRKHFVFSEQIQRARKETENVESGITALEEMVLERQFLQEPVATGWMETRLWQWLTKRERALFSLAFPKGFRLAHYWGLTYRTLLIAVIATVAAHFVNQVWSLYVLAAGIAATAMTALLAMWSTGVLFRTVYFGALRIPVYVNGGVGYREIGRFFMKVSTVQLPWLIPCLLVWALTGAFVSGLSATMLLMMGFKIATIIWAARYLTLIASFSSVSDDTSRVRSSTLAIWLTMIIVFFSFFVVAAAAILPLPRGLDWVAWGIVLVEPYLAFRLYGRFYDANWFDLINDRQPSKLFRLQINP